MCLMKILRKNNFKKVIQNSYELNWNREITYYWYKTLQFLFKEYKTLSLAFNKWNAQFFYLLRRSNNSLEKLDFAFTYNRFESNRICLNCQKNQVGKITKFYILAKLTTAVHKIPQIPWRFTIYALNTSTFSSLDTKRYKWKTKAVIFLIDEKQRSLQKLNKK